MVNRLQREPLLRRRLVDRKYRFSAAALEGVGALARIVRETVEYGEQERAQFSLVLVSREQRVPLDNFREKRLGQVFGVLRRSARPSRFRVDRVPVGRA
jgi:hypothetical protein